jgi:4a-hydroxytetrahydrobiopterin dehydratase
MSKLSEAEIQSELKGVPEWSEVSGTIQRTFQFPDFVAAMRFVYMAADAAEADQHHPDILIRYNKVTLTLSTHDAGGITAKDFSLAKKVDEMVAAAMAPAGGSAAGGSAGVGPAKVGGVGKGKKKG